MLLYYFLPKYCRNKNYTFFYDLLLCVISRHYSKCRYCPRPPTPQHSQKLRASAMLLLPIVGNEKLRVAVFIQLHNDCSKCHETLPSNSKVETERHASGVMSLSHYIFFSFLDSSIG